MTIHRVYNVHLLKSTRTRSLDASRSRPLKQVRSTKRRAPTDISRRAVSAVSHIHSIYAARTASVSASAEKTRAEKEQWGASTCDRGADGSCATPPSLFLPAPSLVAPVVRRQKVLPRSFLCPRRERSRGARRSSHESARGGEQKQAQGGQLIPLIDRPAATRHCTQTALLTLAAPAPERIGSSPQRRRSSGSSPLEPATLPRQRLSHIAA